MNQPAVWVEMVSVMDGVLAGIDQEEERKRRREQEELMREASRRRRRL